MIYDFQILTLMVKGPTDTVVPGTTHFKGDPEYLYCYITLMFLYENYVFWSIFCFKKMVRTSLQYCSSGVISGCDQANWESIKEEKVINHNKWYTNKMAIKLSYMEISAGNKTILVEWELKAGSVGVRVNSWIWLSCA